MAPASEKHVFISYVHENNDQVDQLCAVLEAAQIPYWRDRKDLAPGDDWRAEIRRAIRNGSLVFLACFSGESRTKGKSHMNEELTLAVDEFRQLPPGHKWLIPVRFDNGDLPEWDLGAGRGLDHLNYVDLFGSGLAAEAASLVTTITRLMGERTLSPTATMAAVAEATEAARSDMLRSLTKEMLPDSSRRIALDDLITQESNRVVATLRDDAFGTGNISGTNNEQAGIVAKHAHNTWLLAEPFCASLRVAARWAEPPALTPWVTGIRRMVEASTAVMGGYDVFTDQRRLPGSFAVMTAAIATVSDRRWDNLRALVVDPTVVHSRYGGSPMGLLDLTDPYQAFRQGSAVAAMLSYAADDGRTIDDVLVELGDNKHMRAGYAAEFNWMFKVLKPQFVDQHADDQAWEAEFERAEVFVGILADDAYLTSPVAEGGRRHRSSHWFGRAARDGLRMENGPVTAWAYELERDGSEWGPLKAGLFGGNLERAKAAVESYATTFNEVASRRW
ncbi:toll/interleukin-1 receptor domain-containing protein [Aeromicrobium sp. CF4.19]|uniref:toll/interleukin-1 receptor domain-containing protein n=1 Tax=Aeromicrobium sp. CF4.19 TaxID=3373082 RepID=UPI003EE451DC